MAKKLLECQWSESDISALLDSGCLLQGNVRGLVAHMKQHRSTMRTDHTIYYYTRLRKDHIVVNSKELNDLNHSVTSDTSAVSIVTTSARPKEKEKEKEKEREKEKEKEREKEKVKEKEKEKEKECDALSNPTNALLADHLRKVLQRDRPTICAIFRYADLMLDREDEGGTMERKVQGPPRGNLLSSKRSYPASAPVNQCADISASGGAGNGSVGPSAGLRASEEVCAGVGEGLGVDALGSKSASSNSNSNSKSNSNSNTKSCDGNSKCSGVLLATVETLSAGKGKRIATAKDSKRADILRSPMGPIRDLPPVVDMTPFLKLFLETSRQKK